MHKKSRIFVAGSKGLVGSAIVRLLKKQGYTHLFTPVRAELDYSETKAVSDYFKKVKPEYVFLAAAKVGGILANSTYPAEFIYQNLMIQNSIIHQSYMHKVKKLLFLGSSCIYPKNCPQPMKEEYLMTGALEPTNSPYAVAKIAGIEMCQAYNRQYKTKYIPVMPTNLYGVNDSFDLETSHVLPALIRKFHEAKINKNPFVTIWGTGTPKREFLHVDDLVNACLLIMNKSFLESEYLEKPLYNIGTGEDVSIKELAHLIKKIVGFEGDLLFDTGKPDGTPQKLLDVTRIQSLDWQPQIDLKDGIRDIYQWYQKKFPIGQNVK